MLGAIIMGKILYPVVLLLIFVFFGFQLVNCIIGYKNIDCEELTYKELTFEKYSRIDRYRHDTYEIYFAEYDALFEFDHIATRKLNKKQLDNLKAGDRVKVYYKSSHSRKYDYVICGLSDSNIAYLDFNDYKAVNKSNYIVGMIICSIFMLLLIAFAALLWCFALVNAAIFF